MHNSTVGLWFAAAQAKAVDVLMPHLTDDEIAALKRGRNAKPKSVPARSNPGEYGRSTGLEALFGMLYLTGQSQRIFELWQLVLQAQQ